MADLVDATSILVVGLVMIAGTPARHDTANGGPLVLVATHRWGVWWIRPREVTISSRLVRRR